MKQSLSRARVERQTALVVVFVFAIAVSSCARQSRRFAPETERPSVAIKTVDKPTSPQHVNINTASAAEIEKLPGVGKILAERIVAHRLRYGPFRRIEHLMMVRGVSDHKFRALQDSITAE